jgi:nitroimidazol reductase NimA-like FMN-containing flavoprotein (pyridoxamine 5'-phosphate oxidase superfamily)
MFIHEMTVDECFIILEAASLCRLACARDKQPYVVPMNFAFHGSCLYGFATLGQKIEWMRMNPLVCVEVDEIIGETDWVSVIALGRYEELPDTPEYEELRIVAHTQLQKRAMWWEPAYISREHRDYTHSLTPIFFRIHLDHITGHRASSDSTDQERVAPTADPSDCSDVVPPTPSQDDQSSARAVSVQVDSSGTTTS